MRLPIASHPCPDCLEVADRNTRDHPPFRQDVQARQRLGGDEGIPIREHQDVGVEAQAARHRGRRSEGHEGIERVVTAAVEPLVRGERVFGDVAGVEAGALRRTGELADGLYAGELVAALHAVGRKLDGEAHAWWCALQGSRAWT
jgi:hypothetical protein